MNIYTFLRRHFGVGFPFTYAIKDYVVHIVPTKKEFTKMSGTKTLHPTWPSFGKEAWNKLLLFLTRFEQLFVSGFRNCPWWFFAAFQNGQNIERLFVLDCTGLGYQLGSRSIQLEIERIVLS